MIEKDPRNQEVLFPYLNGEDLNSRYDQSSSRWIINFRDWPLERAETYPDCMRIVQEKVKPERELITYDQKLSNRWWQYKRVCSSLYAAISGMDYILVCPIFTEMDEAVARAYGWDDLDLGHEFHETKQGVRYTISNEARREVLGRLLKLNHERYAEEVALGVRLFAYRGVA